MDYETEKIFSKRRQRWIDALSGYEARQYLQGEGVLHNLDTDEWCCLGVACDVFKEELNISSREGILSPARAARREIFSLGASDELGGADESSTRLPDGLRKYLGLSRIDQSILIVLNDNGVNFEIIGQVLKKMGYVEVNDNV